jgi:hypothetical protein
VGVFPAPPMIKLPIEIIFALYFLGLRIFFLYKKILRPVKNPNIIEGIYSIIFLREYIKHEIK